MRHNKTRTIRRFHQQPKRVNAFELLEDRRLLASGVTAAIDLTNTLVITGTPDDNQIVITLDSQRDTIDVVDTLAADELIGSFPVNAIRSLQIRTEDGDDYVRFIDADGLIDARTIHLDINAGDGDNTIVMTRMPGPANEFDALRGLPAMARPFESIILRMEQVATTDLMENAQKVISDAREQLVMVTQSLASEAESSILPTVEELIGQGDRELFGPFDNLLIQIDELIARVEDFVESASNTLSESPVPEEPELLDPDYDGSNEEKIIDDISGAVQALVRELENVVEPAQRQFEDAGSRLESASQTLSLTADDFLGRANVLADNSELRSTEMETQLASSEIQIRQQMQLVQELLANLLDGMQPVIDIFSSLDVGLGELARAAVDGAAGKCQISAAHVYQGGSGVDIFFPFTAPNQSWLINGGGGNDILFGGFADDEINGGDGSDFLFGLKGNDLIHGDKGIDFLFGEFIVDFPSFTGDDCVFGDDDIDLVIGDNGLDPFNNATPGGNDELHGGMGQDLVIGDDVSDVFSPQAGGSDAIYGDDDLDILFGTSGDDTIEGGKHIDILFGNDGIDTLYAIDNSYTGDGWMIPNTSIVLGSLQFGNDGDDKMYGADGIDVQFGNQGNDEIYGKKYVDIQFGNPGDDKMYGESGGVLFMINNIPVRFGNLMFGGPNEDEMWGGGDLDVMFGNDNDDKMHGYDGNFEPLGIDADVMFGGSGDDTMEGDDESIVLLTSLDWMFGQTGHDTMDGGSQSDFMFGGPGNDTMNGDSNGLLLINSRDLMFGEAGNDTMDGGNSTDLMFGGADDDTMQGDDESLGLVNSLDMILGNDGNDTINGGSQPDLILGNGGNDTLHGDSNSLLQVLSHDLIFGSDGNDWMNGGNGKDFMVGGPGADVMTGDNGVIGLLTSQDIMLGSSGDDRMDGGSNQDFMLGNDGCDDMMGDNGASWMLLSIDIMSGNADCDKMLGGRGTDIMFGNSENDTMDGQWGLDIMSGGAGADIMNGGNLADILLGNDDGDVIHGGSGPDLIFGNSGDDCLYGDDAIDLVDGGDGNDCIHGGSHADWLAGNDGNDIIFGENGPDLLLGGRGNDKLDGGAKSDALFGRQNDDELWGGPGKDALWGNSGNDTLWGGSSVDFLSGGSGTNSVNQGGPDSSGIVCNCTIVPCKLDFGDAPNSYGTVLPNGARHGAVGPRLGANIDVEADGQPSPLANGDDVNGSNDEDGVSISTLVIGVSNAISVQLSNAISARLDAWIDFNANGVFDASDQIASNFALSSGTNTVTFSVPNTSVPGTTLSRFRVSSVGGLGPMGLALDGEVEDYSVILQRRERDYGDAPDSYGTTIAASGPSHDLGGPRLGRQIDAEINGQPSPNADKDDLNGTADEDGVIMNTLIPGGSTATTITLSNAATAVLDAWIDFDGDGVFSPVEHVFNGVTILLGANNLSFTVPTNSVFSTFARFRVSTTGVPSPLGYGGLGEVEDYAVFGEIMVFDFGDAPDSYQTFVGSNGPHHLLGGPQLGTLIDYDGAGQPSVGAIDDDLNGVDDEDGVTLSSLSPGLTSAVTINLINAASARVDAWVDFNQDGMFNHPSELIFNAVPVSFGLNSLSFLVPVTATSGPTYARFRVSQNGGLPPTGLGGLGEVEDYAVTIGPNTIVVLPTNPTLNLPALAEEFNRFFPNAFEVISWEGRTGAVEPAAFVNDFGVRFENVQEAAYQREGDPGSTENLDGYDGSLEPDGCTVLVKLSNHVDGFSMLFDSPVSAVGSFLATGKEGAIDTLTIDVFDSAGNLISSHATIVAPFSDPDNREGFWAVKSHSAMISRITIKNENATSFGNALILGNLRFSRSIDPCDFDADGKVGQLDLERLRIAVVNGTGESMFDINQDGLVDRGDFHQYLRQCLHTTVGDSNLDGEFDSSDLIAVFQRNKYQTGQPASWADGDWNADGVFDSGDLIAAFQAGWYETGPLADG